MNFVDGVEFTKNDECIWNVYAPGASGDLLASIINAHYGRTGSNFFGINDNGQVIFRPSDYKITNIRHGNNQPLFDQQHFYDISDSLSSRNLNYSLLDQFIFSCHLFQKHEIKKILDTFPNARILHTYVANAEGYKLVRFMSKLKNCNQKITIDDDVNHNFVITKPINNSRILNIPFGALFNEKSYYKYYDEIIEFLNLNGRLICYDYVKYYISKQDPSVQNMLVEYSKRV